VVKVRGRFRTNPIRKAITNDHNESQTILQ
jgi:hypothetical protein